MAPRPYEFIAKAFDPDSIKVELCDMLGISPWDLSGHSPKLLGRDLETKMIQRSRLGDLLAALKELRGGHANFNPWQYAYLFVMEHVGSPGDDRARSLADFCEGLGLDSAALSLTYDNLLGIEGDRLMYREKALTIERTMEEQGRLEELLLAVRDACKTANPNCKINLKAFDIKDNETFQPATNGGGNIRGAADDKAPIVVQPGVAYKNFDLFVTKGVEKDSYQVRVMQSPQGQAGPVTVKIPPDDDPKFQNRLAFLKNLIIQATDAETLGKSLASLLFPGEIWTKFASCRGDLEPGEGLRVRLILEPPELDLIPWEYCWHKDYDFIFQDRRTTLVRYPGVSMPEGNLASAYPIRVLLATAVPDGYDELNVQKEVENVQKALRPLSDLGFAEVVVLADASSQTLRQTLDQAQRNGRPFHVLHFVGHGDFLGGQGALALVNSAVDKSPGLLAAAQFRAMVRDSKIKFVFLNACETAVHDGGQPMDSIARSLMGAEVPAVAAMQFKVPDATAILFSQRLYESLAMGRPLDQTIAEVRRAAYIDTSDMTLWGILTFLMRAPNGVIWQKNDEVAAALAAYEPPEGMDEVRQLVADAEATYTAVKPTLNAAFTPIVDASLTQLKAELAKDEPDKTMVGNFLTALSGTMGMLGAEAAPIQEKITAAQTAVADL